ncbi:hypothetical protein COCC4DRAFT_142237 [Bipolaris maydis ATCC 48331]|uniref:Uncharacterized protein n=2 Tax=Cochliobolus heterostrophus TaxID=5016 RepID=M2VB64_COCH5|nr:uncharacterized protein COCC4DRAFT_142237 [Bipolaris maydis ATCC 48331]EMD96913.1 hypothetical protein COCHEDRAFT_1150591 [Bipolaris maydis C5]ENI03783.1 hypothetical protein COCC4DRAFT_142237 [Bipolaris maydis ATCC 48331]
MYTGPSDSRTSVLETSMRQFLPTTLSRVNTLTEGNTKPSFKLQAAVEELFKSY